MFFLRESKKMDSVSQANLLFLYRFGTGQWLFFGK